MISDTSNLQLQATQCMSSTGRREVLLTGAVVRQVEAWQGGQQGITNIMGKINAVENTGSEWATYTHDRRVMQTK